MPRTTHFSASPPEPRISKSFVRKLADFLFGYDFFISYAWKFKSEDGQDHEDGREYARALTQELEKRGYDCFLDSKRYRPGDNWRLTGRMAISRTSRLLLVVTRGAIKSEPVEREIEAFLKTNRDIIPIDCEGILEKRKWELKQGNHTATSNVLKLLSPDVLFIPEDPNQIRLGPSEDVLQRIRDGFQIERQDRKRVRWLTYAVGLFAMLTVVALGLAYLADWQRKKATAATFQSQRNLTTSHFRLATSEIQQGRLAGGLFADWQAYEVARKNIGDLRGLNARKLIASWSRHLGRPLLHGDAVDSVAFSPDGATVLTGSWDNTAQLWDTQTGKPISEPLRHEGWVRAVAFSPDGETVITASEDKTAQLWDVRTGKPKCNKAPLLHKDQVMAVAFSPNSRTILTGGWDNTAQLWDARTCQLQYTLQHESSVSAVAFSPDGLTVLTGSKDKKAQFWDAQTGQPRGKPLRHSAEVYSVAFSPDGQIALTLSSDKQAQLWDARTGKPRGKPLRHSDHISAAMFSHNSQMVLTGSDDRTAQLWNPKTGLPIGKPLTHGASVKAVAFSPNDQTVVTVSGDAKAQFWDTQTSLPRGEPLRYEGFSSSVTFSPDGRTILMGNLDGAARLWDISDAQSGRKTLVPFDSMVQEIALSPDGQTLLTLRRGHVPGPSEVPTDSTKSRGDIARLSEVPTGSTKDEVPLPEGQRVLAKTFSPQGPLLLLGDDNFLLSARVWDVKKREWRGNPVAHNDAIIPSITYAEFSPDGQAMVTVSTGKCAKTWETRTGNPRWSLCDSDNKTVTIAAFSHDGQSVLTVSGGDTLRIWNAQTGKPNTEPLLDGDRISSAKFSPNGETVLTAGGALAQLRDARTLNSKGDPLRDENGISAFEYSPDGRTVITVSDKSARLWDARTGQPLSEPLRHQLKVLSVAFSPDSQVVVTGSVDGTAALWDTKTGLPLSPPLRHEDQVSAVAFTPNGQALLTVSGNTVNLWELPPPAADDPECLQLSVEIRTLYTLDSRGNRRRLTQAEWRDRLDKLDRPCDLRTWGQVSEEEKRQLLESSN
jgi:WD40 repeat protein